MNDSKELNNLAEKSDPTDGLVLNPGKDETSSTNPAENASDKDEKLVSSSQPPGSEETTLISSSQPPGLEETTLISPSQSPDSKETAVMSPTQPLDSEETASIDEDEALILRNDSEVSLSPAPTQSLENSDKITRSNDEKEVSKNESADQEPSGSSTINLEGLTSLPKDSTSDLSCQALNSQNDEPNADLTAGKDCETNDDKSASENKNQEASLSPSNIKSKVSLIAEKSKMSAENEESFVNEDSGTGHVIGKSNVSLENIESDVNSTVAESLSNLSEKSNDATTSNKPNKNTMNVPVDTNVPDTSKNMTNMEKDSSTEKTFDAPEIVPNSEIHISAIQQESQNEEASSATDGIRMEDNPSDEQQSLLNEIKEEIIDDEDPLAVNENSNFESSFHSEGRPDYKYIISPSFELNLDSKFKPKIMLEKINVHSGSLIIKEEHEDDTDYYDSLNSPNSTSSYVSLTEQDNRNVPPRRRGRPPTKHRMKGPVKRRPQRPIKTPSRFLNSAPPTKTKQPLSSKPGVKSKIESAIVKNKNENTTIKNKSEITSVKNKYEITNVKNKYEITNVKNKNGISNLKSKSENKSEASKPVSKPGPASSKIGSKISVKPTSMLTKPRINDSKTPNLTKSDSLIRSNDKLSQDLTPSIRNKEIQAYNNQVTKNIVRNLITDTTPSILKKSKRKANLSVDADTSVQDEPILITSADSSSDQPSTQPSTEPSVQPSGQPKTSISPAKPPPAKKAKTDSAKTPKKKTGRAHRKIFDYESYLREHLEAEANDKKPSRNDINGEPFQLLSSLVGVNIPPSKIKVLPFTNNSNNALKTNLTRKTNENDGKTANSDEKKERTLYDLIQDVTQLLPSWNLHVMPDSDTFCIAQVCRGRSGIPTLKTSIELDGNFNAKVFIHQLHCKRYDGVYDSEESISALIQEIDALAK